MSPKKKKEDNKLFREKMRDKTVGEFLNDQLREHGMTDTGDMLTQDNVDYYFED